METREHLPTLDGWRALSILGVIMYHGRFQFFSPGSWAMRIAARGNLGVDVFFSISGFLICSLLLREHECTGTVSLRRFYLRRSFRILPAYYVALVATGILGALGSIHLRNFELPSSMLFYRNYQPIGGDAPGGPYTAHYWSLAVEEHFYLVWPLIIAFCARRASRIACVMLILVLVWRAQTPGVMGDTRMDGLLWGAVAAIYMPWLRTLAHRHRPHLWIPILTVMVAATAIPVPLEVRFLYQPMLLPLLILSTVFEPGSLLGRMLETRPLVWLGSLSYSLYLWQELFLMNRWEPATGWLRNLQQTPWNLVALFGCALLSRYLVELPMIRMGRTLAESKGRALGLTLVPHH